MTDIDGRLERKTIITAEEMNVAVRGLAADGIVIEQCGHPQALASAEAAEILSPVRGLDGGAGIHDRVGLLEAAREYRQAAELAVLGCRAQAGQDSAEVQLHVARAVPVDDRADAGGAAAGPGCGMTAVYGLVACP